MGTMFIKSKAERPGDIGPIRVLIWVETSNTKEAYDIHQPLLEALTRVCGFVTAVTSGGAIWERPGVEPTKPSISREEANRYWTHF